MNISKTRIRFWIIFLILALFLILGEKFILNTSSKEKTPITVCAPEDMKKAFKKVLNISGLKSDYKIIMTSNPNSNICVDYSKENDQSYTKFAFSPFIIAYNTDYNYYKSLIKSNVLIQSEFDSSCYDIDFLRVINEVSDESKWSNFGIEDFKNIIVFYPSKETPYWNDFYNFMLVTVNNGTYPKTEDELQKANQIIQTFMESDYTEDVSNFDEKVERIGGFPGNVFFVLPEKVAIDLSFDHIESVRFLYPLNTVYFNYYVKGDEIGNQLISNFEKSDIWGNGSRFYSMLNLANYRSEQYSILKEISSYITGERDIYNVSKIPKNKIKTLDK